MVVIPHWTKGDHNIGILLPITPGQCVMKGNLSFKEWEIEDNKLEVSMNVYFPCMGFGPSDSDLELLDGFPLPILNHPKHLNKLLSPGSILELEEVAIKMVNFYKSYRRHLTNCAVIVEELWWQTIDFVTLKKCSTSFFNNGTPEPAASRWVRAGRRAAKVGKGLAKDDKARKLAPRHWLEAIDPRHRYGHNLGMYYDTWLNGDSQQSFFYWLDVADGKELSLLECPRDTLQQQCIKYLGPNERETYEVIVRDGKLVYNKSGLLINTIDGSKWIFVLSTSRKLYVGKKDKGKFQHSSFLAGGAATAAGRLVVQDGILMDIWPYSGHYLPTIENFNEFKSYLRENKVNLINVKIGRMDDTHDRNLHEVPQCYNHNDAIIASGVLGPSKHQRTKISVLSIKQHHQPHLISLSLLHASGPPLLVPGSTAYKTTHWIFKLWL